MGDVVRAIHRWPDSAVSPLADEGTAASTVRMDHVPLFARVAVAALGAVALTLGSFNPGAAAAPPPAASAVSSVPHSPPVPGEVVRPYDPPEKPWLPGHRGVDLAAAPGAAVASSADGVVHFAGAVAGTPTVSVMHPDGIRTTYQPVVAHVSRGESVRRGQSLGILGEWGGGGAGPHPLPHPGLHWGAVRGRDYLNPLDLLSRRPIVLKPPVRDGG